LSKQGIVSLIKIRVDKVAQDQEGKRKNEQGKYSRIMEGRNGETEEGQKEG